MKKASLKPAKQPAKSGQTSETTFPVVGVGASAGGLEAFTELLTALPLDTGMAFVLIQHLEEAEHESMLTELLAKVTEMPVTEVRKAARVEPNHVYVIPAHADLSLADGAIRVSARKAAAGRQNVANMQSRNNHDFELPESESLREKKAASGELQRMLVRLLRPVNETLRQKSMYRGDLSSMVAKALDSVDLQSVPLVAMKRGQDFRGVTIQVPIKMHSGMVAASKRRSVSMNTLINSALVHWLAEQGREDQRQ